MFELTTKPAVTPMMSAAIAAALRNCADPWDSRSKGVIAFKKAIIDHQLGLTKKKCCYCSLNIAPTNRNQIDHFVPQHAESTWALEVDNLFVSCQRCNEVQKYKYDPLRKKGSAYSNSTFRLFHPYYDKFSSHFRWSDEKFRIYPKTKRAKFTIALFGINDPVRMQQRLAENHINFSDPRVAAIVDANT